MSVLKLRLAGPLQSWGAASRFTRRDTEETPTKSGLLGLLAAAEGRRRSDPIEDLVGLELAVRVDQRGSLLRDFHTAHHQVTGSSMPLTERFYWADAVFTAFLGGPQPLLEGLAEALADPAYPLYLGRRSCVPEGRVVLGIDDGSVSEAVQACPWQAGRSGRRRIRDQHTVRVAVQADSSVYPDLPPYRELDDIPVSFSPEHRQYRSRMVVSTHVVLDTGAEKSAGSPAHDPFTALGGE
ncbi:type I-E CRISPR-associated protein Cas5/CasD [Arachnia propionica]|uniref:Type I-E CRISPR-associated protein Cas5/CasD n=1 Tax=Arachnia propionica TaxID=1750 RepID=A0A3P1T353_9ACTN|nr:type I-E CRISPR-associated protein Cas5/CasD [Arachnia propionica]RRD03575.1 type I-E CRISPR-associated protein Cas5/CasD [Arachnia propionica]